MITTSDCQRRAVEAEQQATMVSDPWQRRQCLSLARKWRELGAFTKTAGEAVGGVSAPVGRGALPEENRGE
jgi:hypothetical protein